MFHDDILPPLETDTKYINCGKEEGKEVNSEYERIREKLGFKDMGDKEDREDLKTFLNSYIEYMNKHFMKGFELFFIQLGIKEWTSKPTP